MQRQKTWQGPAALGLVMVLLSVFPAAADEIGESIFLTGFVSQGYLNTSENNYLVPRSVNGTAEFTEAAVTLVAVPADRLRVGIQLLARNFGNTGNDVVVVDWAYGDYRLRDWFGLRLGKVKMPFGFYNEGRDVDMLRTSIFLPQSIYNETMRDFILAYEGVGGYGNLPLGRLGDLDYHLFGGTLNVSDASQGFWGGVFQKYGEGVTTDVGDLMGGVAEFDEHRNEIVSFPWIYGGALSWNTPLTGLRLGVSGVQGRYNMQGQLRYDVMIDGSGADPTYQPFTINLDETVVINHIAVFGAEYIQGRLGLAAEYYHERMGGYPAHGWYVQANWQACDRWAVAACYSDSRSDTSGRITGTPDYYYWQKDLSLSLRVDLTDHWLFKLENHFIDGVTSAQPSILSVYADNPMPQSWGMLVAKTTFHF